MYPDGYNTRPNYAYSLRVGAPYKSREKGCAEFSFSEYTGMGCQMIGPDQYFMYRVMSDLSSVATYAIMSMCGLSYR